MTVDTTLNDGPPDIPKEASERAPDGSEPPVLRIRTPQQAGHEAAHGETDLGELKTLLNRAVEQVGESERQYGSALNELDSRLETLSNQANEARGGAGPQTSATLQYVKARAAHLARQVRQADRDLKAGGSGDDPVLYEIERRIEALAVDTNIMPANPSGQAVKTPMARDIAQDHAASSNTDPAPNTSPPYVESQLDARFRDVANDLDKSLKTSTPAQVVQAAAKQTRRMSRELAAAADRPADTRQLEAILECQTGLEAKLSSAAEQHARLEVIERHLQTLAKAARRTDAQIKDVARKLAHDVAGRVQSQAPTNDAANRLDAIKAELRALNQRAARMNERTLGTLEAMSGALQTMAERVGPGGRDAPAAHGLRGSGPQADAGAHIGALIPDNQLRSGAQALATAPGRPSSTEPNREAKPEPGQNPRSAVFGPDEFIASPRCAAQAAARQPGSDAAPASLAGPPQARPALRVAATRASAPRKQRPVLITTAVFLLIVSAALLYSRLHSRGLSPANRGPVINAPAQLAPRRIPAPPARGSMNESLPAAGVSKDGRLGDATVPPGVSSLAPLLAGAPLPATRFSIVDPATPRMVHEISASHFARAPSSKKISKLTPVAMPPKAIGSQSLRQAAANGEPRAQFEFAARLAKGDGVGRDFGGAARWYRRAAAQGFAPAQYRLAALYERGRGMKRDLARARVWYRRAADASNLKAMHNLAVLHTKGSGNSADYASASQWFTRAAARGLADSQFNLGILRENGLGLRKDMKQAYKWYLLAAKSGDYEAKKRAGRLVLQLTPEDKAQTERQAAGWKAQKANARANTDAGPPKAGWRRATAAAGPIKFDPFVARAQTLLNKIGYEAGNTDGVMGLMTRAAILAFEAALGLEQTGRVTPDLVTRLETRIS